MSDWLNRKDVCQRCFSGIDDDGYGNCGTCAKMDDEQAKWMKKMRVDLESWGPSSYTERQSAKCDSIS